MSLRVSVSDVDSYRYFLESEDMTLDALLSRLRREEPPTENMLAGTALHKWLEDHHPAESLTSTIEADGFRFRFDADIELALPTVREIKALGTYNIDGVTVTLVGKVDAIHGTKPYDHKLTSRFDPERYANAFQWRAYLVLFNGDKFTYNVFTGAPDKDGVWVIRAFDQLTLYRYPNIQADVEAQLTEFVRFIRQYMPERLSAA